MLEATGRDPQVKTPAARLNYGFVSHSAPASRAARPRCPPALAAAQTPGPDAAAAPGRRDRHRPGFSRRATIPDEIAKSNAEPLVCENILTGSRCVRGRLNTLAHLWLSQGSKSHEAKIIECFAPTSMSA